jgi:hypothetical protein
LIAFSAVKQLGQQQLPLLSKGDKADKDSNRRLTFSCTVVSISFSKRAGLSGKIGCVGRLRANGKGIFEYILAIGSSIP